MRGVTIGMALAGLLALGAPSTAAETGPAFFSIKQVGPGVYAAIDNPDHSDIDKVSWANAGFVIGADSVLVIDTFANPAPAQALLAEIRKLTDKPIRYVVNTHFHLDHVTGNAVFRDAGPTWIVMNRKAGPWFKDLNMERSAARNHGVVSPGAKALYDRFPQPDILVDRPVSLYLGNRRVEVRPAEGHTGGDLIALVPDAKVVFAGDLLWNRRIPTTMDGHTRPLLSELKGFNRMPEDTVFVPGHGPIATRDDVKAFRRHIAAVEADTAAARANSLAGDLLVSVVKAKLQPAYGTWTGFDRDIDYEIRAAAEEQAGTKKTPQP